MSERATRGRITVPGALWVDDCKPLPEGIEAVARTYDDAL